MKRKLSFTIYFILGWSLSSLAQTNIDSLGKQLSNLLKANYSIDSATLSNLCGRGCTFVKFSFDKRGQLAKIAYSKDSLNFLKRSFPATLVLLKKDKELIGMLKRMPVDFILPIIYDFELGCSYPLINMATANREDRYKYLLEYYKSEATKDFYLQSLLNMLNFQGNRLYAVKCILLTPLTVGSMKPTKY